SVVLLRSGRRSAERARAILLVLTLVDKQLDRGAVVTVEQTRLRVIERYPAYPVRSELPRLPGHFVPRPAERALVLQRLAKLAGAGHGSPPARRASRIPSRVIGSRPHDR
ncbi:MAG TPA: hypothetical protein VFQ48_01425, partial [Pseudonocardiaceae bacterium]|nr:hypothetical protein [Pseudonocardiaceae bacterium]